MLSVMVNYTDCAARDDAVTDACPPAHLTSYGAWEREAE